MTSSVDTGRRTSFPLARDAAIVSRRSKQGVQLFQRFVVCRIACRKLLFKRGEQAAEYGGMADTEICIFRYFHAVSTLKIAKRFFKALQETGVQRHMRRATTFAEGKNVQRHG